MNNVDIISLIFSGLYSLKASNTFVKGYCNICHRILLMQINIIFLHPCSEMGAGIWCDRSLGSWSSLSEVRFFKIIIFEIFERYFVLFDIWWWHLCRRCFLKYLEQIFQLTLISAEDTMIVFVEGDGIWWLSFNWCIFPCLLLDGEKRRFQRLLLDGEKFVVAFGRSSCSANVSWNPFPFSFYCANWWNLTLTDNTFLL